MNMRLITNLPDHTAVTENGEPWMRYTLSANRRDADTVEVWQTAFSQTSNYTATEGIVMSREQALALRNWLDSQVNNW